MSIRGKITVGTASSTVRIIVFKWKAQSNVDVLTPGKILHAANIGTGFAPMAHYEHDNKQKFTILSDRTHNLYSGSSGNLSYHVEVKPTGKNYFYAGSTINQFSGIYVLEISDNAPVGAPQSSWVARLEYIDL